MQELFKYETLDSIACQKTANFVLECECVKIDRVKHTRRRLGAIRHQHKIRRLLERI